MKWEYKIVMTNVDFEYSYTEESFLSELGKEGWEFVYIRMLYIDKNLYYFKRPVNGS